MGPDHRWPLWHPNRPSTPGRSGHLNGTILIYGATGYTGELVARVAADQGARPILAGRNLEKVEAVAKPLGLTARAFDLRDPGRFGRAVRRRLFLATSHPVADPVSAIEFSTSTSPGKSTCSKPSRRGTPKPSREA